LQLFSPGTELIDDLIEDLEEDLPAPEKFFKKFSKSS